MAKKAINRIRVTRHKNCRAKYDQEWQWEKKKEKLLNIHNLQKIEKSWEMGLVKNGGKKNNPFEGQSLHWLDPLVCISGILFYDSNKHCFPETLSVPGSDGTAIKFSELTRRVIQLIRNTIDKRHWVQICTKFCTHWQCVWTCVWETEKVSVWEIKCLDIWRELVVLCSYVLVRTQHSWLQASQPDGGMKNSTRTSVQVLQELLLPSVELYRLKRFTNYY